MKKFIEKLSSSTTFRITVIMLTLMILLGWAFGRTTTYIVKGVTNANRCIRMSKIVNRDIDEHLATVENLVKASAVTSSRRMTQRNSREICDSIRNMADFDSVYIASFHNKNKQVNEAVRKAWLDKVAVWSEPHVKHLSTLREKAEYGVPLSVDKEPIVTLVVPLQDRHGKIYAMLCADMNMVWLRNIAEREDKTENSELKVIAKHGLVIESNDPKMLMTKSPYVKNLKIMSDDIQEMSATNMFSGRGDGIAIRDSIAEVNSIIPRTGWLIRCSVPMHDGSELASTIMMIADVMLFILFGLIVLSIFLVLKWQLNPVLEKYMTELQDTTARNTAMERDLDIASKIQIGLLPKVFPDRKDLDMFGTQLPAKTVGGDIFDYIFQDKQLVFCIGDVSGKGVPAALFMSAVGHLFRNVGRYVNHPEKICRSINASLSENNDENMFCTLFVGVLDIPTGKLSYCNAGHNAPIIIRKDKDGRHARFLETKIAMPCGAMAETQYLEERLQLTKDDMLFLYTDGVTEAENTEKTLFGDEKALNCVETCTGTTSQELIEYMVSTIQDYEKNTEQSDDITMLSIRLPKVGA